MKFIIKVKVKKKKRLKLKNNSNHLLNYYYCYLTKVYKYLLLTIYEKRTLDTIQLKFNDQNKNQLFLLNILKFPLIL